MRKGAVRRRRPRVSENRCIASSSRIFWRCGSRSCPRPYACARPPDGGSVSGLAYGSEVQTADHDAGTNSEQTKDCQGAWLENLGYPNPGDGFPPRGAVLSHKSLTSSSEATGKHRALTPRRRPATSQTARRFEHGRKRHRHSAPLPANSRGSTHLRPFRPHARKASHIQLRACLQKARHGYDLGERRAHLSFFGEIAVSGLDVVARDEQRCGSVAHSTRAQVFRAPGGSAPRRQHRGRFRPHGTISIAFA